MNIEISFNLLPALILLLLFVVVIVTDLLQIRWTCHFYFARSFYIHPHSFESFVYGNTRSVRLTWILTPHTPCNEFFDFIRIPFGIDSLVQWFDQHSCGTHNFSYPANMSEWIPTNSTQFEYEFDTIHISSFLLRKRTHTHNLIRFVVHLMDLIYNPAVWILIKL